MHSEEGYTKTFYYRVNISPFCSLSCVLFCLGFIRFCVFHCRKSELASGEMNVSDVLALFSLC